MFLKNRAVQIRMVNTKKTPENLNDSNPTVAVEPEQIAQIATDFAIKTIGAVGVVIAGNRVLTTICEIVVVAAKAKLK